ncbi:uncharacterized protein LOC110457483 [Mizuhopecten yessoensis]|uniref:Uncharacterized protein n=1 Tax=Mizuhopecten yessoensis TaxID=6573 RepID=A0A210Q8J9_MIZYE|nr:uncharacterized protein LOC110457483 [Mizuhopecten yessoensis]OWF45082.1 hypothetical protein KP79_PYT14550 [Mizuhopecten yessoensis]
MTLGVASPYACSRRYDREHATDDNQTINMILFVAVLIGVADLSLAFPERYCNSASSLALVYQLNKIDVQHSSFSDWMKLWDIDLNDILVKDDLLFLLGDMCGSRKLTFEWLFQQIERYCPQPNGIRSLLEPTGVVCNQDGTVSDLTKTALGTFGKVNKSIDCTLRYTNLLSNCETDARFSSDFPVFPEQTLETDIIENTMISTAAIRCALTGVRRLAPDCGSVQNLLTYSLVSELITRQPFKLRGNVNFQTFADVKA